MTVKKKKLSKKKELEKKLADALLREGDIPPWHNAPLSSHYCFNKPDDGSKQLDSGMQMDFAWLELKVGIEVNGGQWARGKMGHNSGTGLARDARKNNWAILKGWLLIQLVTDHIDKEMISYTIPLIRLVLREAGAPVKDYDKVVEELLQSSYSNKWYSLEETDGETRTD